MKEFKLLNQTTVQHGVFISSQIKHRRFTKTSSTMFGVQRKAYRLGDTVLKISKAGYLTKNPGTVRECRGRQMTRYRDEIRGYAGAGWNTLPWDSRRWSMLGEIFF